MVKKSKRSKTKRTMKKKLPDTVVNGCDREATSYSSVAHSEFGKVRMPKNKEELIMLLARTKAYQFQRGVTETMQGIEAQKKRDENAEVLLANVNNRETLQALVQLGQAVAQIATDISHAMRLRNERFYGRR